MNICFSSCSATKLYKSITSQKTPSDTIFSSSNGQYTLNIKNMSLTIDADFGGRITSLKLDKQEMLSPKNNNLKFYGSTLWLSPQGKWKGHGVMDTGKYQAVLSNNTGSFQSQNDTVNGFKALKEFTANVHDTSVKIVYTITNISKSKQQVAPWEVTRVPTHGLAYFPKGNNGDIPETNQVCVLPHIVERNGIIWYPYDSTITRSQKLYMNGSEGWIAYAYKGLLFIKKFPVISLNNTAPGEKNVELFVNKENTYIELENQGRYQELSPSDSLKYTVIWYIRKIPDHIPLVLGEKELIDYTKNIIKQY